MTTIQTVARPESPAGVGDGGTGMNGLTPVGKISLPMYEMEVYSAFYPT